MEYYGGTLVGAIRFLCITLFLFSLIGARKFSEKELTDRALQQRRDFEGVSFPTPGSIQHDIVYASFTGTLIREHAPFLMIEPTVPENISLRGGNRNDATDRINK